jgi:hypothetical protein
MSAIWATVVGQDGILSRIGQVGKLGQDTILSHIPAVACTCNLL